jgi:SEC-C motif-containing protein
LVLGAVNQDGGAHVDPSLDSTYADLTRNNSLRELRFDGISWEKMPNVESATLRQITHEILQTVEPDMPPPIPKREDDGYLISGQPRITAAEPTKSSTFSVGGSDAGRAKKIGRHEPCPCGTKKKYKKCCGK